ncbi:MAG TPA: OmpA family protein [Flavisolibacter sp.]|nr:OmpA family protein [Flavisolibacter sp.]
MRIFIFCFFLLPLVSYSQELLVNGNFEEENICSECKVNCAPEGWIYTVPSFIYYFKDDRLAHSGNHFVALIAGHAKKPYYRTFVRSRLICGLRKDHRYRLQFYIKSTHPVLDSMGVYFSAYDFLFEKRAYRKIDPSVYIADALVKPQAKDTNWQKVVIDYKATGDEAFITLGNFSRNNVTGTPVIGWENNFFVLMDDFSFTPLDSRETLCDGWQHNVEEIYAQDERHEYLDRLIKYYRSKPLETVRPSPTVVQKVDTLVLPDILFETGSYALSATANTFLDSLYTAMGVKTVDSIVVEGHTDSVGTNESNQKLGYDRAVAVRDYFQTKPLRTEFVVRSWGSEKPIADNRSSPGRQKNRRVEIYLYIRE